MLGLDSNVLVRYLVRDDQQQFDKARRLIKREADKGEPVLVSLLVLLETEWVLRSRYELSKPEILSALSTLLDTSDLAFEDEPSIERALYSWKDSVADFADCLIEARNRRLGCQATATFDTRALRLAGFISASGARRFEVERDRSREQALKRLRALKRPLPNGFRFDQDEANAR